MHCVFAVLMFSVPSVFPQSTGDYYNDGNFTTWTDLIYNRVFHENSRYHALVMGIIIIEFMFDFILSRFLKYYFIDLFASD